MPAISRFLGITMYMRDRDHPPPHLHVRCAGNSAIIDIDAMRIIEGQLPARIYGSTVEWGPPSRPAERELAPRRRA